MRRISLMGAVIFAACAVSPVSAQTTVFSENFENASPLAPYTVWENRTTWRGGIENENPLLGNNPAVPSGANAKYLYLWGTTWNGGLMRLVQGLPTNVNLMLDGYWRADSSSTDRWAEVIVYEGNFISQYTPGADINPSSGMDNNIVNGELMYKSQGGANSWNGLMSTASNLPHSGGDFVTTSGTITLVLKSGNTVDPGSGLFIDDIWITAPTVQNTLQSAASRYTHAGVDHDLDLALPVDTAEPRLGANPKIVLTFAHPPTGATCANFTVSSFPNGSPTCTGVSVSGNSAVLTLSGVINNACLTVSAGGIPNITGDADVSVLVHQGDVNSDGAVNLGDLLVIKNTLLISVQASNFLNDVNADGAINLADLQATKNNLLVPAVCQNPE